MIKKLFLIGNGFDIHHGIPSRYSNYRDWLEENDADLMERLRNYYDVDDKENAEAFFKKKGIKEELMNYVKLDDMLLVKQGELEFKE